MSDPNYYPTEPNLNDQLTEDEKRILSNEVREGFGDVALAETVILEENQEK